MSSSHIVSVTIGEPSKSACVESWPEALDRESAESGVHSLGEQPAHLGALVLGGGPRLRGVEAHHVGHQRRGRQVLNHVDALGRAVERVHVLRNGLPIPLHPDLHRLVGNRLGARHRQHRALAKFRLDRHEAEAAVAEHHRGDAVPSGDRAVRIPSNLRVVMRMQIDEAGRDDQAVGVDDFLREAGCAAADLRDLAVLDPDVGAVARHARAVNDGSPFDLNIEFGHSRFPPSKWVRTSTDRLGPVRAHCAVSSPARDREHRTTLLLLF